MIEVGPTRPDSAITGFQITHPFKTHKSSNKTSSFALAAANRGLNMLHFSEKGEKMVFLRRLSSKELIQDGPEIEWYQRKSDMVKQTHFLPVSRIT